MDLENITKIDSIVYVNVEISSKNSYLIYSVKDKIIVIVIMEKSYRRN